MNLTGAEILSNSSYNLYTAGVRIHVVRVAIKFLSIDIKNDWFKSYIRVYLILLLETPCSSVGSSVRHVFYPHLTRTHTNLMCDRRLEDDNDNNNEEDEEEDNDNNDDKEE